MCSEEIFGIEPNTHAIYLDVKLYLANQRQGTHKSKNVQKLIILRVKSNARREPVELVQVALSLRCS